MPQPDFSHLQRSLHHLPEGDVAEIRKAFDFACKAHEHQKRNDGSPYVIHVIEVAAITAEWQADKDTIIAALLHDVLEDTDMDKASIREHFGHHVSVLVEGVTKFTQADFDHEASLDRKIETLRKLFEVMRQDLRVALIKLADRMHNVQTINALTPERAKRFAKETLDIYYKLAAHLGMRDVRQVYAEYCVPCLFGERGAQAKRVRDALCEREQSVISTLRRNIQTEDETGALLSVEMQPRNLLVFHGKMEDGGEASIGDAFSLVVIVRDEESCYRLLQFIHTLYHPVSGQFRDYIAAPNDAGYRSLHTSVTMPNGNVIQLRIRTPQMDEQANHGVAVLLYKERSSLPLMSRFSWLQRSEDLDLRTKESSSAFWEAVESDILRETISVTIDRRRISIPLGATALDAAYAVHKIKAGFIHHLSVSGKQVPFSYTLREDDDIYAAFVSQEQVTFDWLQFVMTKYARSQIVEVLKLRDKSEKVFLGSKLIQNELDHYNKRSIHDFTKAQCNHVAAHFRREHFEDVVAMVGEGVIRARDVVFFLFPEHKPSRLGSANAAYPFRLQVRGAQETRNDVLSELNALIKSAAVTITDNRIHIDPKTGMFDMFLSGTAKDRLQFADFIELLERQDWTSKVSTMIPRSQKLLMLATFAVAFTVVLLDVLLFPLYGKYLPSLGVVPEFLIEALPLLPILVANYYLLRLLRHYVARMRTDRWFLGVGFMLNIVGLLLIIVRILLSSNSPQSLFPLMTIFILSLLYLGYTFFQADALFSMGSSKKALPLSVDEWRSVQRRKIAGYVLRLAAVTLWGIQPLYIKYTSANQVPLSIRVLLIWVGIFLVGAIPIVVRYFGSKVGIGKAVQFRLPILRSFVGIVVGYLFFMFCFNMSLHYTSSTNVIVLNSFSPVLALFVGLVFWRQTIPYLRHPRHMAWIFVAFMLGSAGGSLIVYHDLGQTDAGNAIGDLFALGAMVADTLMALSQIRYMRRAKNSSSLALNVYVSTSLLVITAPIVLIYLGLNGLPSISSWALLNALGVGILTGVGQLLNYETFRRIDGFIAFLMFNISILITFAIEVFFLGKISPHWIIIIGGLSIIGSTVLAETINSRCQRRGL